VERVGGTSALCLHDRTIARSDAEIGLQSLCLSISQGGSLGDFMVAPSYPKRRQRTLLKC